jgi:hypothetical protein
MSSLRKISLAAALVATLSACAPMTPAPAAGGMPGMASPPAAMAGRMAMMDTHMKSMREMHDKMARARTPEERNALMAEHMKLMQDGMAMMGGMGPGGMRGMGAMSADGAGHQQMMEKRMEMMQSMMQMMMDRMSAAPPSK